MSQKYLLLPRVISHCRCILTSFLQGSKSQIVETWILSPHSGCQQDESRTFWFLVSGRGRPGGLRDRHQLSSECPFLGWRAASCGRWAAVLPVFYPCPYTMEKFRNILGDQGEGREEVNFLVSAFSNGIICLSLWLFEKTSFRRGDPTMYYVG